MFYMANALQVSYLNSAKFWKLNGSNVVILFAFNAKDFSLSLIQYMYLITSSNSHGNLCIIMHVFICHNHYFT